MSTQITREYLLKSGQAFNLYSSLDNEIYSKLAKSENVIMVTSATRGEGRSTIALLLAIKYTQSKPTRRVLVVDADQIGSSETTKTLLRLQKTSSDEKYAIINTEIPNVDYVKTHTSNVERIGLDQEIFEKFIEHSKSQYDLVIVDASPGNYGSDLSSVAKIVKNTILVIQYRGPKREQIQSLIATLKRVDTNILGTVINKRKFPLPAWIYGQ